MNATSRSVRCLGAIILGVCISGRAQIPAFPGALGFGANVTGGRGGTVYHVTTLADSGPGSFRDAVSHSHRIIVFDVGGYIKLNSAVSCSGDLTIAGQTAPGGGIGFSGGEISFSSRSNVICRYLRIRPGSETASHTDDALAMANARTMIFDHCSFEFGPWNNIDAVSSAWQTTPVTDVTFQNCLNADPSKNVTGDATAGQQFGAHTESVGSRMSWIYCAFANSHNRNPLAKINTVFINNVDYNCSAGYTTHTSTAFSHDIVNNYFVAGPAYSSSQDFPWFQVDDNQSIYYAGNLFDGNEDGTLNGSPTTPYWYQGGTGTILTAPWSSDTPGIPTYSAPGAFRLVISQVGALPRDQIDNLVISQMKTLGHGPTGTGAGTAGPDGSLYSDQTQTGLGNGGYGVINGGVAAIDSDNDGMPDYWEAAVGLNPNSASDATTIASDGYANIEHYLNWLAGPHVLTSTNSSVDIDLWQFTSGFTNASPAYAVNDASNGVATLNNGHVAHFTPNPDFTGLASFQFSVRANDGTGYTNVVSVVVTPLTPPENLIWAGDGVANVWTNGGPANWSNGSNLVAFASGDNVTFDDTGSAVPAINLSGPISAGAISVIANNQDYTFAGSGYLSGGGALLKTGSSRLTLDTANTYVGGTTINDGIVQIGDGVSFNGGLAGGVTNNDTLIFATPGTLTSAASISGGGTLFKTGSGALTLSGTETYTGPTTISGGVLTFSGSVPPGDITNNGSLILAPSGSATTANSISGSGTVSINTSGTLTLSGPNSYSGGTTNAGGTLNVGNNSAIGTGPLTYLSGSVHLADGTVVTNTFVVPSSTSDSMMDCVSGTATWAGDVVLTGGGAQFRPSGVNGNLILTGHGAFGNRNFIIPRGSVRFASNAVFSASGTASAFDRNSTGNSAFVTVEDNASVSFAQLSLGGGQASGGRMILTISDAADFSVSGNFDLHNSTASAAISSVHLDGGTLAVGGFIKTRTGSSQLATNFFNGGTLRANANNASFLPALSGFKGVVQAGGAVIDDGGFSITVAAPLVHDALFGPTDGGLKKLGAGILTLAGANTYNGDTIVSNGTLAIASAGSLGGSMNMVIAVGATLEVSGGSGGGLVFGSGRKLSGNGTVNGNMTMDSGATLAPGGSIGALTFNNSLTLNPGCTNIFEISQSPLTNDAANCLGQVTLGGTLIVVNIGATPLAAGDTFPLFKAESFRGAFSTVKLPDLPAGLAWDTNALNRAGTISIGVAGTPVIESVSVSGNGLVFSGSGGVGNAGFILLDSTNLTMPFGNWAPLLTNRFDVRGNFSFTNVLNSAASQTFYRLQLQ